MFRIIIGDLLPDKGMVKIGEEVKLSYFSQMRENLNSNEVVWREICDNDKEVVINKNIKSSNL